MQFDYKVLSVADQIFTQEKENSLAGLKIFDQEKANIVAGQSWAETNLESPHAKIVRKKLAEWGC